MDHVSIIRCDYNDHIHEKAFLELLNAYSTDDMGQQTPIHQNLHANILSGMKEHPSSFVLFAETGSKIVGMAVCFIGFSTFRGKKLVNVHDLIVLPSSRGLGIGRKLMKTVELISREMDCCKITLEVRQDNHLAQSLYIGEGYSGSQPPMLFWSKNLD